ncbi:MAG: YbaN family protein [Dysgonomonas sp.]
MLKYIYITLGVIALSLGLLGIVTPGLPTTPFILLTAFLFAKSSPSLHKRLVEHKITGPYIKRVNTGLSLRARLISIGFMWCMIGISAFIIFRNSYMMYVMLGLGVIGTVAQLIILRKKKPKEEAIVRNN